MCGRYQQPYELLEIVQRVSMEQRRRIKGEPEPIKPIKPILLAFDGYDVHNGSPDMNLLNVGSQISDELSRIIEMAPGTNVNVVMVRSSIHPSTVGQKLYDRLIAGNHVLFHPAGQLDPHAQPLFHAENTREAETLTYLNRHLDFIQARNCLYETSNGSLRVLHTPFYKRKEN